ncbi:peptidoglycan DD-metalloendopeptidase family protein [Mammaliicoccus sp. R-M63]|uniref:peptidoglycan DD-metalloendopeptidase family protein n=2 Tax=Staphylococcaceae TaxID=90964 RepID=UPI001EFA5B46|nr:peptidoglycan DD-metalloendopeptidase family protein [Mammaliicoccus sp. R-M63]
MDGEIKGLQVDVSMDTSKFEKGYSQIKRSMSTFNSALKNTRNEIKYGEKSQQSYKNHMDNLKTSIAKSETNVKQLSKAYEGLSEEQKRGVKGHQFISQMAKEEDQMRRLKNELQSTQLTYGETYTAMGKIGQSFKSVGAGMQNVGSQMQNVGRNLSNSITKPALIAGTAMAGITAKLGFDRLVGLDTAKAKLEGLGYSTKDVGRITDQVTNAIKGGMTTMAEGTDVAAGALAAGVKEGKELEKYIKLVGDAAVGSNRPVADMAQIFNRVQGQGKLMTQELNMVEEGMPGFSNAMAEHMGVSYEAFREMVTEGKVTSKDFLTVMDDFAGGMAGAYSKSWKGMIQNSKAYIGILGESMLKGVFPKAKESLYEFTQLMQSKQAKKWAEDIGKSLSSAFSVISNAISGTINWWKDLDKNTQNTLGGIVKWLAITLVTVGPLLTIFGKLVTVTGGMFATFGALAGSLGKISFMAKEAGSLMGGLQAVFPKLATSISVMTGPVGWITAGVVALGIAFVVAYKKSETFRNIVNNALNGVKTAFDKVKDAVLGIFNIFKGNEGRGMSMLSRVMPAEQVHRIILAANSIKQVFSQVINAVKTFAMQIGQMLSKFWKENGAEITEAVQKVGSVISTVFRFIWGSIIKPIMNLIWNIMKLLWPAIKLLIVDTWNNIKNIIKGALDVIMGVIKIFSGLFTGNWKGMWQGVKQATGGALKLIWAAVQLWFIGKILKVVRLFGGLFKGAINGIWKVIKGIFNRTLGAIFRTTKNIFTNIFKTTKSIFTNVKNFLFNIWNNIRKGVTSRATSLWNGVRNTWNNLRKGTSSIFAAVRNFAFKIWTNIKNGVVNRATSLWNGVKNRFTALKNSVSSIFNNIKENSIKVWDSLKNSVIGFVTTLKNKVTGLMDKMGSGIKSIVGDINGYFDNMIGGVKKGLNKLIDGVNWVGKKLGMDEIKHVKLHTGTTHTQTNVVKNGKIAKDTFATVGDKGRGNGPGGFRHEMIRYPNGKTAFTPNRDTTTFLPKGSSVLNGKQTHSILNSGTLPKFAQGTKPLGYSNKKPKKKKKGDNIFSDVWDGTKEASGKVVDGGKAVVSKSLDAAAKGKKWLGDKIGDVMDWIDKPKKLLEKVLEGFGVSMKSFGVSKKAELPFDMMKGMYKKLKTAATDTFKTWFEEQDSGDGDSKYINLKKGINFPFSPNGKAPGYPFDSPHYGVDLNYVYDKLYAVMSGKATARNGWNGGFGTMVDIVKGATKVIYGHMSKHAFKGSKNVKPGDYLGVSGNTGRSSGPHLHFEVQKNGKPIDPLKWLKNLGSGGGSKPASRWRGDIVRAGKEMGVRLSNRDIKDMISLIQTESNGNAGVTQGIKDENSGGNEARGLLQYTPKTWAGYKVKGKGNIMNGYHQLLAFLNNTNWRRDLSAWKARMARGATGWGPTGSKRGYATGGLINANGLYNLAEDGHPEFVIPTDPKRQSDAMKLLAIASQRIEGNKKNKRPNQMRTPSPTASNNNAETLSMLAKMVEQQQEQINILTKIALSNQDIADKPVMSERDISKAQGRRSQMMSYNLGGAF